MVASLPLDLLLLVLSFCSGDDVNIMPPLSVVNHAIYQSSHTNRKRISALKNPPFNIARPSLAKNLKLYSDSMMVFVHACESGVFLPTLRDLDISPNRGFIGDAKMTELFRAIATGSMGALEVLSLDGNDISDPCMIAFSNAIRNGSMGSLQELWLGGNAIGDAGMIAFADALKSPIGSKVNLKEIDLCSNNISDAGMISLSDAIGKGSLRSLTSLRFDDNKISDPGVIAFAEALKSPMGSMGKLDYLQLDGNKIGDEGMVAFSAAISSGSLASLTSLVVNDKEHPQLKAACHQRGIRVHDLAAWHQGA